MPPFRRIGRPGLIGTAARTAVIAGTASATAGAVQRRQTRRAQQQYEAQQYEARQQAPAPPPPAPQAAPPSSAPAPATGANDALLAQLGELHSQGVLDDAEFAAAKARLLG